MTPTLVALAALVGLAPLLAVLPAAVIVARSARARGSARFGSVLVVVLALGTLAFGASIAANAGGISALRFGAVVVTAWFAFMSVDLIRDIATTAQRARFRDGLLIALVGVASISVVRAAGLDLDAGETWSAIIPALSSDANLAMIAVVLSGVSTALGHSRLWRVLASLALGSLAIALTDHPGAIVGIAVVLVAVLALRRRSAVRASLRSSILVGVVPLIAVAAAVDFPQGEPSRVVTWRSETVVALNATTPRADTSDTTVTDGSSVVEVAPGSPAHSGSLDRPLMEPIDLDVESASSTLDHLLASVLDRSAVGVVGVLVLVAALFAQASKRRDVRLAALALVVLVVTSIDAMSFGESVLVPLAAVVGWRRPDAIRLPAPAAGIGRRVVVITALVATEIFLALTVLFAFVLTDSRVTAGPGVIEALLACTALWPFFSWRSGMFPGYGLSQAQELRNHVSTAGYVTALCVLGWYVVPALSNVPLATLLAMLGATAVLQVAGRAVSKRLLLLLRLWGRPVVILGAGDLGRRVARGLLRAPLDGLHPVGFFDDDTRLRGKRIEGIRVRGTIDAAHAFATRHAVRHAIVALSELEPARLDQLITGSSRVFWRVQYVPDLGVLPTDDVVATDLDGNLALEIHNGLYQPKNRIAKRVTDMLLGSMILLLISPVLALIWLLVRLDSRGGALHLSPRVGEGGRSFHCLKFRTMFEDAEERLEQMLASDPELRAQYDTWHKLEDDPRITRVGRFLRRTSLDELPQLWNVVRGDMSLVGPRPYLEREIPEMSRYAEIIHHAKPGMTGLWQIRGRSAVTFRDRLEMEARYVRNWSIWWDVVLLTQTPMALLRRGNAGR